MILYFSYAGRIKQRILCCRKFIIMFSSSDLFIEQLLALAAECRLLKFSFRAWQKYCILSLLSLGRFSEGILINISSKKNAFVRVFTLTILWLSAILKLGFLKSPGKSGSARPSRGMKLGNTSNFCKILQKPIEETASKLFHTQVLTLPQDRENETYKTHTTDLP